MEVYHDDKGDERCDNCGQLVGEDCICCCTDCGDYVSDCGCPEGPSYPAVMNYQD